MLREAEIQLVKTNLSGGTSPNEYTDEQISALLDRHKSVAYVSYKLCLLNSQNDVVTLGPIKLNSDADYWKRMSQLFYNEYLEEQQNEQLKSSTGSTILMKRADGT
jgi:hypothetical protein|nr:MAG TPA: hypothetical protein [Caudoviricetes sp.]